MNIARISRSKNLNNDETSILIVFMNNDELETVHVLEQHPRWEKINELVTKLESGEVSAQDHAEELYDLVNILKAVEEKISRLDLLDGRFAVVNGTVTYDLDPIDETLSQHILSLLGNDGEPYDEKAWVAFSRFVENLYSNVNKNVREQLYRWLDKESFLSEKGFTITEDGCLLGYKGCQLIDGVPHSSFEGTAYVDGVKVKGHIPNKVGSVIEMPASMVQNDPAVGCSTGLHIGTYDYAANFARDVVLLVKFNPRDVISVPTECSSQKIRACRYEVVEETEFRYNSNFYYQPEETVTCNFYLFDENDELQLEFPLHARYQKEINVNGIDLQVTLYAKYTAIDYYRPEHGELTPTGKEGYSVSVSSLDPDVRLGVNAYNEDDPSDNIILYSEGYAPYSKLLRVWS